MRMKVKVIANSSRNDVSEDSGRLKVHLKAIPMNGKANEELMKVLAEHFNVKKGHISILKGKTSNIKEVEINQ